MRLFLVLLVGAILASDAHPAGTLVRTPNILVILTDDQGRGDYSAFGTKDVRTPAIDRLYREGMAFDNFYANSPVCSPTARGPVDRVLPRSGRRPRGDPGGTAG